MRFELVSPERSLASMDAAAVRVPGADGDMTAMAGHAPVITTLRPGVVRVEAGGEAREYVVTGGFAEVGEAGVSVLAERAVARADMTRELMDEMLGEAREALARAGGGARDEPGRADDAAKLLADMEALGGEIGLGAGRPGA